MVARRQTLEAEMERLRNLYRWGDLSEDDYLAERRRLAQALESLPAPTDQPPSDEVLALVSRFGDLWREMTDSERRAFVEEVFEEVRLARDGAIGIRVRSAYRELVFSALDAWWRPGPSRQSRGS